MTDHYRALCVELLQFGDQAGEIAANEGLWPECDPGPDWLLDRARAALAQPEPQMPTDEELDKLLYREFTTSTGHGERVDAMGFARAVLQRWGNQ